MFWVVICDIEWYDEFVLYVRRSTVLVKRGTWMWNYVEICVFVVGDCVYIIVIDDYFCVNVNVGVWRMMKEMESRRLSFGARFMRVNCGSWYFCDVVFGVGVCV